MRVLVIGASGFIGQHLVGRLNGIPDCGVAGTYWSRAPRGDANSWYRVELADALRLEEVFRLAQPDVVVHLAAIADVGMAEREPERATAVNVGATSSIARLTDLHGAKLVFVSTEYVFDGRRGYYREDDTPSPTTHYGRTKMGGRAGGVRDGRPVECPPDPVSCTGGRSRAGEISHPGSSSVSAAASLTVAPSDVYRTPVYVGHLTDGIVKLVQEDHPGIHHVAGETGSACTTSGGNRRGVWPGPETWWRQPSPGMARPRICWGWTAPARCGHWGWSTPGCWRGSRRCEEAARPLDDTPVGAAGIPSPARTCQRLPESGE